MVKSVFVVIVLLIISSIVLFAPSVHNPANQTQDKSSISPHRNDFSKVRYSSLDAKSSSHPIVNGVELAPFSKIALSGQSNNTTNITYYSVTISFISMPFSFYNGSWILQFIFDGQPYYFIVGYFDYKYASFVFAGLTNGTYFLTIEPIPYPYYEVSYPSVIVINGSNVSVDVTFPAVHFEFEIYITGIPSIDGMGVWTDYIGMNPENLTFPPFIDLTSEFFAKSTAQNFYPNAFGLPGSSGLNEQAMIEGEMLFFGVINSTYFQYNVSLILTNGTLISGNDSAILFNVTFVNSVPDTSNYENFNGLYLPPDAVFNNVSMSFMNAPGNVSWNGVVANYGGISYGNYGNDQFSLSEHNVIGTVGALNSLISSLNNTGFSTFAFGWCNLYSSSFLVVPAFVPEYGTEIVPGFLEYSGLFSGSGYNFPVGNVNGNISQIIKSPVIINSSNLYSFYSTYYPSYAYYDYYPYLADAVNVTESSVIEPVYLSSAMMNFIPIKEEGMAVGGWGWNMRWAYPVFYPSASYYPSKIANLPKWMGIPYVFSDLNSPFSTAYLLGNYKNLSFTFNLYFFNGTTLSPPFGGGASNVSDLVNGSLPDSNISYWLNLLESYYGQDKALYPYYWEGWMPFVVINISIPYHLIPVIFYSGAEAVVSQVFAPYKVESYAYYNNGSLFQNISGWRYANSSYVVRLLTFKAPSSVSYMYGVMRDDYVISFENLSFNSVTPFAVNYSNLPNGTYGSYAGFPSEFVASYVNYAPSLPAEVGESGSVNYMSFGSFKYILSYALYPYPVPMVYAVQDSGNGTFSSSNPFNYFTFHSFGNKTVFDVSTVNANFTWLFNWSAAIGSTDYLSYMTLTSAVPLNVAYVGSPPGLATLQSYNGSSFWSVYNNSYYPSLESGNFSAHLIEPSANVTASIGQTNVTINNNQSKGVYIYVGLMNGGNFSVSNIMKLLGIIENSTSVSNSTINTTLTNQQESKLLSEVGAYSYGTGGYAILHIGFNKFSYSFNVINGTLFIDIPVNGTVVKMEFTNVSEIYYIYYAGVFGYLDSYIGTVKVVSPSRTGIPLWVLGIIPGVLLMAVIIHDVINWLVGGTDRDSIFFWRKGR